LHRKLSQFYLIKTTSRRLKNANWNINISINQARENGEIVSIGENQVIRTLLSIKGITEYRDTLESLFAEKKKIKRSSASFENYMKLVSIDEKIDRILFIPEIVSVVIDNNSQYKYMISHGFFINDRKFVRLLCGAGQSRRNTVFFIDSNYESQIKQVLNNGRNPLIEISPAKFNAYFALANSATHVVSQPYFCVIPDCEIEREEEVEYIEEIDNSEDEIFIRKMKLPFNLFDGQGIISPRLAKEWAEELELDYIPATFVIRNAFMKGMVCTIDFHAFSEEIGNHIIKDVWGNDVNIRDMDLVITASQFKLWDSYDSCNDYISKCKENGWNFGISKYSPKEDACHVFSNYQFLQVLNLNDSQIESLCKKTVDYFEKTLGGDINYTLMYLLGKNVNKSFDPDIFDKTADNITKSLMLNNSLINDPYVYSHILRSLNKKIKESYIGNLLLDGNYQIMISDPYAFMEHMFGLPVNGLLNRGYHYSNFWNKRGKMAVVACRAPLTWRSEINKLSLVKNENTEYWYKYLNSGIVYNVHGNDCMIHADSDVDGDLVMTTDQQEFIAGVQGGFPITYNKNKIPKEIIDESKLWEFDAKAFNTRIGFITNCSTTLYSMLESSDYTITEKEEIVKRLKICRKEQGNQIDKAKGLFIKPFPVSWTRRVKREIDEPEEEKEKNDFNDRLIISKRPYFMRWLYSNYNKDYKKYKNAKNTYCIGVFGYSLEDFLLKQKENLDEKELWFHSIYLKNNPLLDSNCLMNKICHYMEKSVQTIKENHCLEDDEKLINLIKDDTMQVENLHEKLNKMLFLYEKYKKHKQSLTIADDGSEEHYRTVEQYNKSIRQEAYSISSNIAELANIAIAICYVRNRDRGFVWNLFGEGIVENVIKGKQEKVMIPFIDKSGNIEYLGNRYSLFEINMKVKEDDGVYSM
jgi:hypothetical protein